MEARPDTDFGISDDKIIKKIKPLWIWNHDSEKSLLKSIFNLLKNAQETVYNAHKGMVSPVLCGIGITSSDIPILFELFKRYQILTNAEAFSFQNKFRVVDLSQLSISTFKISNNFLYPKSKSHIINKYISKTPFEQGKVVWKLYESKYYNQIESRVMDELIYTHKSYQLIISELGHYKSLEMKAKRLDKMRVKHEGQIDYRPDQTISPVDEADTRAV